MLAAFVLTGGVVLALWLVTARRLGTPAANGFLRLLFQSGAVLLIGWAAIVLTAALQ
jgi:hypothetical protein